METFHKGYRKIISLQCSNIVSVFGYLSHICDFHIKFYIKLEMSEIVSPKVSITNLALERKIMGPISKLR